MSLILEALKKSEAERRLGQAPGLMTPMPTHRAGRRVAPMLLTAGLIAVFVVIGAWWMRDRATQTAPTTSAETPAATVTPAPTLVGPMAETIPEEPAVEPTRPTTAAAKTEDGSRPEPPEPARSPKPAVLAPAAPEFDSVERESIPAPPPAQESRTPPPLPGLTPPAATAEPPVSHSVEPAPSSAEPAQLEAPSDLPRLDQLSSSERDALPPLKLSMHVYAQSPVDRFVLVDGRRYREGEKLAPSLQVVEIRREGVVLDFNGRQFLLLRP